MLRRRASLPSFREQSAGCLLALVHFLYGSLQLLFRNRVGGNYLENIRWRLALEVETCPQEGLKTRIA